MMKLIAPALIAGIFGAAGGTMAGAMMVTAPKAATMERPPRRTRRIATVPVPAGAGMGEAIPPAPLPITSSAGNLSFRSSRMTG